MLHAAVPEIWSVDIVLSFVLDPDIWKTAIFVKETIKERMYE